MMSRLRISFIVVVAVLLVASTTFGAVASLPSVSVSGVTATSPVLRASAGIAVSANVTSTFDTNSGPTTIETSCSSCNNGNHFCGTDNSAYGSMQVLTTTSITVANKTTTVTAADFNSSASLSGGGPYTGTLGTPLSGTDGVKTVTVSAIVSEDVTTTTTITTKFWSGHCSGTVLSTSSGDPTSSTVTKTGSGSNTGAYVLDINAPLLTLQPDNPQPFVQQGSNKFIHNVLYNGSANTAYTLTDTAVGPGGPYSANGSGTFGPDTQHDGIAPREHDIVAIHIPCDAPTGVYIASGTAYTVDLGNNSFDPINSVDYTGPPAGNASALFTVTPGIFLEDQTLVVAELPPSGDYAPMLCFTSTTAKNGKVNTFPGSLHITATANTTGPCSGFGTISGTVITLTLPSGFKFDTSGASPAAHVFVGPSASGFDLHYPQTLAEVTSLIPKPSISGQTVTVNLSSLNLGFGAGVIPSSDTIYVRAHAVFSGSPAPAEGTQFVFSTTATTTSPALTNNASQTVTASASCVDGHFN